MPESPEVQALVEDLGTRLAGREITDVDVVEFRAAKTRTRPPSSLRGERVSGATRHGKHVDLAVGDAQHLVVSLGRHGWARYANGETDESVADAPPTLVVLAFDDGTVVELTDAGDWVSLGCFVVDDPKDVPAVSKLGPDPADPGFTREDFDRVVAGRRKQVKAVLQEQESIAGVGNAYSDEILHLAKVSPVAHAAALTEGELDRLFEATVGTVRGAIERQRGVPIDQLKAAKVASMRVHGRAGETCPACGDTVLDFSFASTTAQYCPTCQTGGEHLPLRAAE
ncbi:formamidopyrimidine-DNA glycosylase [Agromyces hippuratus]|uniref:Formamidopyrimidine-DNA glycosylase n=1 Tax=Agromyces hippuratus TaxID=286438 RepID=A0A852X2I2_9MICO|nr:DNA-formamidopyrimidine glycosylase family protein [Agromyces hippuratus]NYG22800.1 formamidopyrimidine-DNA glycosylase [Agromyces hippuratus]